MHMYDNTCIMYGTSFIGNVVVDCALLIRLTMRCAIISISSGIKIFLFRNNFFF